MRVVQSILYRSSHASFKIVTTNIEVIVKKDAVALLFVIVFYMALEHVLYKGRVFIKYYYHFFHTLFSCFQTQSKTKTYLETDISCIKCKNRFSNEKDNN